MRNISVTFVLAIVLVASGALALEPPQLLEPTIARPADSFKSGPAEFVVRSRYVTVAPETLELGDRVQLDLFADVKVLARERRRVQRGEGRFSWFGDLEGQDGNVVMVVSGERITAHVRTRDRGFMILHAGDGVHTVKEIDLYGFPPDGNDGLVPPGDAQTRSGYSTAERGGAGGGDDGSTIDVLVVYTDDVLTLYASEEDADDFAQLGVDITNDGYERSDVSQRLRLVDARVVDYDESTGALGDLTDPDDGDIDIAHVWRDECAADIVSLWVTSFGNNCGSAWTMTNPGPGFEDNAFNVVRHSCIQFYFSFGHELGHNMGAKHNIENSPEDGAYPFSHGLQVPEGPFRTTLAYSCSGGACDPRVNQFSNPDVLYGGEGVDCSGSRPPAGCLPTGNVEEADNARTFDLTAPIVAAFRESSTAAETCLAGCSTDAHCDDGLDCNGEEVCVEGECLPGPPLDCGTGFTCVEGADPACQPNCPSTYDCGGNGCQPVFPFECDLTFTGSPSCYEDSLDQLIECDLGEEITIKNCDCTYPGLPGGPVPICINENQSYVCRCTKSINCDDGLFCNGVEYCDGNRLCHSGTSPCLLPQICDEAIDACIDPDLVTIIKAEWNENKEEIKVEATSDASPTAVLTLVGFGEMDYKANQDKYVYKEKPVPYPPTVTVTSDQGGQDTADVEIR